MPIDRDKLRSIGQLRGGRTMSTSKTSGREHPESGLPFQTLTDETGTEVTEHGERGTGLSVRQDVNIHPEPIVMDLDMKLGG